MAVTTIDELIGEWQVQDVGGTGVIEDSDPALVLTAEGRISGSTGLNRLAGSYEFADGELRCTPLAMTRMAGPAELMAQEARFMAALERPAPVRLDGWRLILGDGRRSLVLARIADPG